MPLCIAYRLQLLQKALRLSSAEFASHMDMPEQVLRKNLTHPKGPTLEFVAKVPKVFPSVSLHWLFTGEGEMLPLPASLNPVANYIAINSGTCTQNIYQYAAPDETLKMLLADKIRIVQLLEEKLEHVLGSFPSRPQPGL